MSITDALIFKHSGQYDLEVVERLRLENLGISRFTNLDGCISLTDLSLASNSISDLSGLSSAGSALKRLDLSNNKIKSLVPLEHMTAIEHLDLRGNEVSFLFGCVPFLLPSSPLYLSYYFRCLNFILYAFRSFKLFFLFFVPINYPYLLLI